MGIKQHASTYDLSKALTNQLIDLCNAIDDQNSTSPPSTSPENGPQLDVILHQLEKVTALSMGLQQRVKALDTSSVDELYANVYVPWNESMDMPLEPFNEHHKKLVAMVNELYMALVGNGGREDVLVLLDGLMAYTQYHFGAEERNFEAHNYPHARSHCQIHQNFIDELGKIKNAMGQGNNQAALSILRLSQSWLFEHIMQCDREYIAYFKNKKLFS